MGTTERSFAFNGVDLFILTSVCASCGLNNDVDCSRVYSVEECLYPNPIDTEKHGNISTFPFKCDEIVKHNGSTELIIAVPFLLKKNHQLRHTVV